MVNWFEHKIVEVEAIMFEVFQKTVLAAKGFSDLAEESTVLVVEERAAVWCRFTHKQRGDASRPKVLTHVLEGAHGCQAASVARGLSQNSESCFDSYESSSA